MSKLEKFDNLRGVSFLVLPSGSIRCRLGKTITGTTVSQFVGNEDKVVSFIEDALNSKRRREDSTLDLTLREKGDASAALDYLRDYGLNLSLLEVCKDYVARLPQADPILVSHAVNRYLDSQSASVSDSYYRNLKTYFTRFTHLFGDSWLHEIDKGNLEEWLNVNTHGKSKKTYDNYLTAIKSFFVYSKTENWISIDPSSELKKYNEDVGAVSALKVKELKQVLQTCKDEGMMDLLVVFALQSFAGVRRAEACRLKWGNIGEDAIRLDKSVTKTKKGRGVELCLALKKILKLFPQYLKEEFHDDLVFNGKHDKIDTLRDQLLRHLDWDSMPKNVLRHSFCSYKLALTKDAAKVSYEAGNSPDILAQHYDALVSQSEAKKYFKLKLKS